MEVAEVKHLFAEFSTNFDSAYHDQVWENQSTVFQQFWKTKILNPNSELTASDIEEIVRLLDTKARGHQKTDEAVAQTGVRQGVWSRMFDDLKTKSDIQATMNEIFLEHEEAPLIKLVLRLQKQNKENKNGLTGEKANALNTLLFINDPMRFVACVSLSHRFQLMKIFELGDPTEFGNYGEQVVLSNSSILNGFRQKYGIVSSPRVLSEFLYAPNIRPYWQFEDGGKQPVVSEIPEPVSGNQLEFVMETHLEEFLVRNWESTELGKKYELIEEDGELVSQQYPTDVGRIDLLVREKRSKQFVVIELKKGQTSDDTVGQIARYMGWVKKKLADGKDVKGILIAGANDMRLQFALSSLPNVELFIYKVSFALREAELI